MEYALDIETTIPCMTKRVKVFKPKQQLQKSEVQTLVAFLKKELEQLDIDVSHRTQIAMSFKNSDKEFAELYFKRADKARKQRNKLAVIQGKLKRGLV